MLGPLNQPLSPEFLQELHRRMACRMGIRPETLFVSARELLRIFEEYPDYLFPERHPTQ
jgi:hypothetical protein